MKKYMLIFMLGLSVATYAHQKMKTDTLCFNFEGKRFSGIVNLPDDKKPIALILLIPGSGKTNMLAEKWNSEFRNRLTQEGFACYIWDKAGCGRSEGVFDANQLVQNSAKEAIAAIEELKRKNIPGSEKIGLWAHSRGGWICPLIIADFPSIAFWISVSAPDDKETYGYFLEKNFLIEGRSKKETKKLMHEWQNGFDIARHGGTFEENLKATENLRKDPLFVFMSNNSKPTAEGFLRWQKQFQTGESLIDKRTGLQIYVPEFKKKLNNINCPVLAIFGKKDTQVNWRKTTQLYKRTIGKNSRAHLTIKTFPNGNHNIFECKTGGFREKLRVKLCEGYYESMLIWLKENVG